MSRRAALLVAALSAATPGLCSAQSPSAGFGHLVREAWEAVDTSYYDATFGGLDWTAVRDTFLAGTYAEREDAYAAIRRMLGRFPDRATRFLRPEQADALLNEFAGKLPAGIGVIEVLSVDVDEESGDIVVVTPPPATPAARAGLRPGDVIESVDGVGARTLGLAETMSRLRGAAGTSVTLTLRRGSRTFDVRIPRVHPPPVDPTVGFVRVEAGERIGYLGLRQFTAEAPPRLEALVDSCEAAGVAGYVLDLRNNPGGLVPAVERIAAVFVGPTAIARLHTRASEPVPLVAQGAQRTRRPVVVLVNEGTASAAEVLAGTIQDHGRGVVLGARTFGKGLAHGFQRLSDDSAVLPTVGRLETMGGRDLLDEGIQPDSVVVVPVSPVIDDGIGVATPADTQYRRAVAILLRDIRR